MQLKNNDVLLKVSDLCACFTKKHRDLAQQDTEVQFNLSHISFSLKAGQRLGIAGESGSGKSLLARILMGLESFATLQSGEIFFNGHNIMQFYKNATRNSLGITSDMQKILGKEISYIPQDPLSSLNPLHKVYKQIEEVLYIHNLLHDSMARKNHIFAICDELDLEKELLDRYPHELSGGQRQRVAIALALIANPKLIICDEPTSALDIFLSAQIVELLESISYKKGIALLFITHDLHLLQKLCEESIIIRHGRLIETLKKNEMPKDTYTKQLFDASMLTQKTRNNNQSDVIVKLKNFSVGIQKTHFFKKQFLDITKNVNIHIREGKTLGIIGQSGSGKSSLAQGIMHLMETMGADFYFQKQLSLNGVIDKTYLKYMRSKIQIVFQDSNSALNPRFRVYDLISEGLLLQRKTKTQITQEIHKVFECLGLNLNLLDRYPHELSGGQRQRVAIARAMILWPKILILDEPTSALDKFIQKDILELLLNIQQKHNLTYLLITHDLNVVRYLCDDVAVISKGEIVEYGTMEEIIYNPKHHYTKKMMNVFCS